MDKTISSLPELFYDLIAIFIPGYFSYFCFSMIYSFEAIGKLITVPYINETVSSLVIIYLIGFVVYFFSSFFIAKIFNYFFGDPKVILLGEKLNKMQKAFNRFFLDEKFDYKIKYYSTNIEKRIKQLLNDNTYSLKNTRDPAFELCRNYVMEKYNRSTSIRKEQAYGEMSRGIVLVSLVSLIWIMIMSLNKENTLYFYWYKFAFFLFSFITFAFRYGQAKHINPLFIYSTFISAVDSRGEEKSV